MKKIRIMADSTCDLSKELIEKYEITIIPLCIILDDVSYYDGLELSPQQIFEWSDANKKTPKTAAVSFDKMRETIEEYMNQGDDIIYFAISEDMSTTCNVARLVGDDFETGRLFVINSMNLSTGIGLQVLRAAEMAQEGKSAEEIVETMEALRSKVRASFVVDTLVYLARGGRCSGAAALVGGVLKLHPMIKVVDGKMQVGKKYRGTMDKILLNYAKDLEEDLLHADPKRVFITHSFCAEETVEKVRQYLESLNHFEEIIETKAGGVICSHCGQGTLGVLFYEGV